MLLEVGRVCIKRFGRDAGDRAVITAVEENGFVRVVTTKRHNERRCNPRHLEFLNQVVDVKSRSAVDNALGIESKEATQTPKA
ncbi:MAG: 50S ribosomal protein L14e [Candidatus Marsarchaeota archaeon]|jgi:ribosomal protein L14E/L6E/L27E|nr:50S ribosomal protein L14e [Candidatus Marsarchaeota archaeon]